MELTSEQRTFLAQRKRELRSELDDLLSGRRHPQYVSPDERRMELQDELERIEVELRADQSDQSDER